MNKYLCIHGHFYQPPRENPWTGFIDEQKSAAPHHDWNERISFECYEPNTHTQILNNQNKPFQVTNNFSKISFNVGPTLLSWLERNSKQAYQDILRADEESIARLSGHGNAIAQVYNHMIMPLANERDKQTQINWGIRDFETRFKRWPEGMWLSETAVDISTLELLADHNIKYTILAPTQAKSTRAIGAEPWTDTGKGTVDTQVAYSCPLPSGKNINLFFYNGKISNEVAFGKLLKNGMDFANRLIGSFPEHQHSPRLAHIANDGETYGHHHDFGNMALAYMIHHVESNQLATITNYGEFLEKHPPNHEVQIVEDSSWSCFHGVERWRSHCGCRINLKKKWSQEWRKHLRDSLDWLRDQLIEAYEKHMNEYFKDPWGARDAYIDVLLDQNNAKEKIWSLAKRKLTPGEQDSILQWLEMQHQAMLMYTSCGWFFDDISGIETVQILQFAARAMQITKELTGKDMEFKFLNRLEKAKSNIKAMNNGRVIYDRFVRTAMTTSK